MMSHWNTILLTDVLDSCGLLLQTLSLLSDPTSQTRPALCILGRSLRHTRQKWLATDNASVQWQASNSHPSPKALCLRRARRLFRPTKLHRFVIFPSHSPGRSGMSHPDSDFWLLTMSQGSFATETLGTVLVSPALSAILARPRSGCSLVDRIRASGG